jgi:3-phenylpropionate/trans-cinnamate dioxygenase ferredoxin reductase subunit
MSHIVIIGAGQAGFSVANKLRALDFSGEITLIGDEAAAPYERPPLSKAYLNGDDAPEHLSIRPASYYTEQNIRLLTNTSVSAIDPQHQRITCKQGNIDYDQLVLAIGAKARQLPAAIGGDLDGVFTLRSQQDAEQIKAAFTKAKQVLVVGGGYIGLEMAATARSQRLPVTLLEAAPRILQRVAGQATADYFRALHQSNGVDIYEGIGLQRLGGVTAVTGAVLENGGEIAADCVIVGIGAIPDTALAETAGITCENGVVVDEFGRTSVGNIWAAGDCTAFPYGQQLMRLESVQGAIEQGERVAENLLGAKKPYRPNPWFWSDQYQDKLQIAGLQQGHDQVIIRSGDKSPAARSHWYYRGDALLAVDVMNEPKTYLIAKRLLEMGKSPAAELIADQNTKLKPLLKDYVML